MNNRQPEPAADVREAVMACAKKQHFLNFLKRANARTPGKYAEEIKATEKEIEEQREVINQARRGAIQTHRQGMETREIRFEYQ